jgi:hypothetical protein
MPMAGTLADALAEGSAGATRWHTGILPHGKSTQRAQQLQSCGTMLYLHTYVPKTYSGTPPAGQ